MALHRHCIDTSTHIYTYYDIWPQFSSPGLISISNGVETNHRIHSLHLNTGNQNVLFGYPSQHGHHLCDKLIWSPPMNSPFKDPFFSICLVEWTHKKLPHLSTGYKMIQISAWMGLFVSRSPGQCNAWISKVWRCSPLQVLATWRWVWQHCHYI